MTAKMTKCERCNGTGRTIFKHVENGICFECGGSGQSPERKRRRAPVTRPVIAMSIEKLRDLYREAREERAPMTLEDIREGGAAREFAAALRENPRATEAFRGLGWDIDTFLAEVP